MVLKYDTGESRATYHNRLPREQRFFEALGIEPMPMEEAHSLLEHATPTQAKYIEAYYFSEQTISWRGISKAPR